MFEQIVFYCFAAMLIFSAGMVVSMRNPVLSVLFLVLSFFTCAAIWLLLQAEFLAIVLVLVYVGAVMVLFLFVVMMLDINLTVLREGFAKFLPVGIGVAILMMISMGLIVGSSQFDIGQAASVVQHDPSYSNTKELGLALYTDYLYPFEIAGAILLVAIIAAISLTMRKSRSHKTPKPEKQVSVKRNDRVRIVKMESENN
jgi:NADH-quinone oxidoreductase subunit J